MLDLSFGLPITIRDAALKMIAPGPNSGVNREYYAQEHEKEIEEGRGGLEAYEKTDEKARDLLRRLANSEPYYKKQRRLEAEEEEGKQPQKQIAYGPGPIRNSDSRTAGTGSRERGGGQRARNIPRTNVLPPQPKDILPPADPNITSLFVTGVEDDLPEHALRTFFTPFGTIRSLICSHRSHCAFINYAERSSAETAVEHCQGRAVIQGCPLRVTWGKPKPLDNIDREERLKYARQGRDTAAAIKEASVSGSGQRSIEAGQLSGQAAADEDQGGDYVLAAPPGASNVQYASLSGE